MYFRGSEEDAEQALRLRAPKRQPYGSPFRLSWTQRAASALAAHCYILSKARPGRASVPVSPHSDPFVAVRMWRQASLPDSAGGFQPLAGVWTFSAEITGGTQPAGLAEGSRWSFRARGERPPESCIREGSTQEGCQSCAFVRSIRLRRRSGTPPGCMTCLAPIRRSPPPKILGDLRL